MAEINRPPEEVIERVINEEMDYLDVMERDGIQETFQRLDSLKIQRKLAAEKRQKRSQRLKVIVPIASALAVLGTTVGVMSYKGKVVDQQQQAVGEQILARLTNLAAARGINVLPQNIETEDASNYPRTIEFQEDTLWLDNNSAKLDVMIPGCSVPRVDVYYSVDSEGMPTDITSMAAYKSASALTQGLVPFSDFYSLQQATNFDPCDNLLDTVKQ
jgi:hypothetical protein